MASKTGVVCVCVVCVLCVCVRCRELRDQQAGGHVQLMESVFVGLVPQVWAVSSVWRTPFRHCKNVQVTLYYIGFTMHIDNL